MEKHFDRELFDSLVQLEYQMIYHPELPSTQKLARSSCPNNIWTPCIYLTETQTASEGRWGTQWYDEKHHQLLVSINLLLPIQLEWLKFSYLIAALILQESIAELGIYTNLKWPNDIYYQNKKCAGALVEKSIWKEKYLKLTLGYGVNCLAPSSKSCYSFQALEVKREHLLACLINRLINLKTQELHASSVLDSWRRCDFLKGKFLKCYHKKNYTLEAEGAYLGLCSTQGAPMILQDSKIILGSDRWKYTWHNHE